jgi:Immunity protein 8
MSAIRPILKRLHSPDIFDLEAYSPDQADDFSFLLQAMFGPEGQDGEESFDMIVCTPKWLQRTMNEPVLSGRHHLIVRSFDIEGISRYLTNYAQECVGSDWREGAEKLARIGKWEFEDYVA